MKSVAQITQAELIKLIAEKLSADGIKVIPTDYPVQLVTSAAGETSALITGIVKDPEIPVATPEESSVVGPSSQELPAELERSIRIALQVMLTFKPRSQEKLVKSVLEVLAREEDAEDQEAFIDFLRAPVKTHVVTALQEWTEEGKLVYVDEIDAWHKKRASRAKKKQTPAQAAADALGGSGGVMNRGDALGAGVSGD